MVVRRRTRISARARPTTRRRVSAAKRTVAKRPVRKVARKAPVRRKAPAQRTRIAKRSVTRRAPIRRPVRRVRIGRVSHFFTNINVAVVDVEKRLRHGDKVHVEGANTNFRQLVRSMQVNRTPVKQATAGSSIGLKVNHRARPGNVVYKLLG